MRKKTIEDYVEILLILEKEKQIVHTNDVANALGINPASATEIFQKLGDEGYINYVKYSGVTLTPKGRKLAIKTKKKHDTLKEFLILLGVDSDIADEDACKIEHHVHQQTMDILRNFVAFSNIENGCSRWLDHFRYYDKTGEYIFCTPNDTSKCPLHSDNE